MRKLYLFCLAELLFCVLAFTSYGRNTRDTTVSTDFAIQLYRQFLFPEKNLYTGRQYIDYKSKLVGNQHPYVNSIELTDGAVFYDGMLYEKVPLQYDIVRNVVFTWDPYRKYYIELEPDKLDWFTMNTDRYVHVKNTDAKKGLTEGLYHVLYQGKIQVLKKESKIIRQEIDGQEIKRTIHDDPSYYLVKNGTYYPVSKKASVLKVLNDKKSELNNYIRKNDLDLSKNKDNTLAAIAAEYDTLTR